MMKTKPAFSRKLVYGLIVLGFVAVALINFLSWFFLQGLKTEITGELKSQIKHLGNISTRLINGNDLEKIVPGMESHPLVIYYQQLLYELKLQNNLENILLLDPAGHLLVDFRVNFRIGDSLLAFPIQPELLRQASLGKIPEPHLLHWKGQYFLTAYFPIFNDLEEPTGVLVVDAPMEFFRTLYKFERGSLLLGASGLLVTFLFAVLVIWATHRQLLAEARLREQERLAQLGQMAATVAHEIRNPLSIMKGSAEVLARKFGQQGQEMVSFIIEEIDRLNRLVDNFLRFARQPQLNMAPISLPEFFQELLAPMQPDGVRAEIPEGLPPVLADRDALQQILLNLIRNAREACQKDCTIIITAQSVRRPGRGVLIRVADTGPGIPPEVLSRVFEPFFSTRATGSGLGLAICKQLTEAMGGTIHISSEPGKGTTVSVWLPEGKAA